MALLKWVIATLIFLMLIAPASANWNYATDINITNTSCSTWYAGSCANAPIPKNEATDNDLATDIFARVEQYSSGQAYIQIDLGTNRSGVMYLNYTIEETFSLVASYIDFSVSSDNVTYTTVHSDIEPAGGAVFHRTGVNITVSNIRYIRSSVWNDNGAGADDWNPQWYEIQVNEEPIFISPANGSIQYYNYPPLNTNINFTWLRSGIYSTHIQVAKDINFNLLSVDTITSNNYSVQALQGTQQYWFRGRTYNSTSGIYGNWSDTFNFNLTANNTANAGSVQGIVYELLNGAQTPVNGASVFIYNTTWSSTQVTGSNGYYLFQGLSGTYYIQSTKDGYDPSALQTVNVSSNVVTQDILMKVYISPYVPNFVYEKFIVRGLFDNPYPGVTMTVYKGSDLIASFTGTTDSAGQAVFRLIKDQQYRITLSGGGLSGTLTYTIYAKEESYVITIISGFPIGGNRDTDILTNLTTITINATYSNLSLIYQDNRSSTTAINFYATNLTTGATCTQSSSAQSVMLNCTVLATGTYRFGFNATSSIYGIFYQDKIINFNAGQPSNPAINLPGVSTTYKHWLSIMLIVLVASLGSIKKVKLMAVLVPAIAMFFWSAGWLQVNVLFPTIALVIGIMIYMRVSQSKVDYQ